MQIQTCRVCNVTKPVSEFYRRLGGKCKTECKDCSKECASKWHYKNRDKRNARKQDWRDNIKLQVISHYSSGTMQCVQCREAYVSVLCIDHIRNNGAEERRRIGYGRSFEFYRWLVENGFPKGYQVLCFNCNQIKHIEDMQSKRLNTRRSMKNVRYRDKLKLQVVFHYSNGTMKCKCGCSDIRALTIDHINGGGRAEVKRLGISGGVNFYYWLVKNRYPKGYQVLCANCNQAKE